MHKWFGQKLGNDIALFGIVDEVVGNSGHQYNMVYGEGTKHGSIQVAAMSHYFFNVFDVCWEVQKYCTVTETPALRRTKTTSF